METVLTLSKSIPVNTQVPIQVLLEEERTEPERSPWEEATTPLSKPSTPPPPTLHLTLPLSQHLLLSDLHGPPNERSNLTLLLGSGVGAVLAGDPLSQWWTHTHTQTQKK